MDFYSSVQLDFTINHTIYNLYVANKLYLKDDSTFYHTNDLIFTWLTNCSELEEMTLAVSNPLHRKEQTTATFGGSSMSICT